MRLILTEGESMRTWHTVRTRSKLIGRRQFSVTALAVLGGATIAIGCGGGGASDITTAPTTTSSQGQNIGVVSGNHPMPHVAAISAAQLSAGDGIILDISNGLHSHTVALSGAQVTQIAAGAKVSVDSSINTHSSGTEPHGHTVTFN
jgi:hypothetical protein